MTRDPLVNPQPEDVIRTPKGTIVLVYECKTTEHKSGKNTHTSSWVWIRYMNMGEQSTHAYRLDEFQDYFKNALVLYQPDAIL